jgi:hypothetical protein
MRASATFELEDSCECCGGSNWVIVATTRANVIIHEMATAVHPYQRIELLPDNNSIPCEHHYGLRRREGESVKPLEIGIGRKTKNPQRRVAKPTAAGARAVTAARRAVSTPEDTA